jgi:hypothetical protein
MDHFLELYAILDLDVENYVRYQVRERKREGERKGKGKQGPEEGRGRGKRAEATCGVDDSSQKKKVLELLTKLPVAPKIISKFKKYSGSDAKPIVWSEFLDFKNSWKLRYMVYAISELIKSHRSKIVCRRKSLLSLSLPFPFPLLPLPSSLLLPFLLLTLLRTGRTFSSRTTSWILSSPPQKTRSSAENF